MALLCFGYQGFRSAKFGGIDSHIAVCAFARKTLLDATRTAERNGFTIQHGIVDSLWLQKEGATEGDYEQLCAEMERETGSFLLLLGSASVWFLGTAVKSRLLFGAP